MERAERAIVASALGWDQAHVTFEEASRDLAEAERGRRPAGSPHSPWELVEHIRIGQLDLLEYLQEPPQRVLAWPEGYWPDSPRPPTDAAWGDAVDAVVRDRERIEAFVADEAVDLAAPIPWGEGRTSLRTILLALDHTAYHVGQLVLVRRLLGAWPPGAR